MASHSLDQVIQSTRASSEYSSHNQLDSTLSVSENGKNNGKTPCITGNIRKPIQVLGLPPSSWSNQPSVTISNSSTTEPNGRHRSAMKTSGFTDFFSHEVFHLVLRNPTTSHRLLKFCQKRGYGESMEFLAQLDKYHRLLDDLTKNMSAIQKTFTGPNAETRIDIPNQDSRVLQNSIKHSMNNVIPNLECIFLDAEEHIEKLLLKDIYPRFVKQQVTTSATLALGVEGKPGVSYQGLGDSFCLTNPSKADNPIVFASDGFIDLTGYSRKEVIPRNCRFLQSEGTDRIAIKRLKASIESAQERVELLLNYRKNGEPFWNLLYVTPLYDHRNKLAFFLGGQINCSTTIHNYTDILRILSLPEDDDDGSLSERRPANMQSSELSNVTSGNGLQRVTSGNGAVVKKGKSWFFKSWIGWGEGKTPKVIDEPGMEGSLTEKFRRLEMDIDGQVEAFYSAYSKYLILRIVPQTNELIIEFYSPSMVEFLLLPHIAHKSQTSSPLSRSAGPSSLSLFNRDIFKVLADQPLSANIGRTFKNTVRDALRNGKSVSVEVGMMTGVEEVTKGGRPDSRRVEEMFESHWTVLKDENGRGQFVVLTIAPKES